MIVDSDDDDFDVDEIDYGADDTPPTTSRFSNTPSSSKARFSNTAPAPHSATTTKNRFGGTSSFGSTNIISSSNISKHTESLGPFGFLNATSASSTPVAKDVFDFSKPIAKPADELKRIGDSEGDKALERAQRFLSKPSEQSSSLGRAGAFSKDITTPKPVVSESSSGYVSYESDSDDDSWKRSKTVGASSGVIKVGANFEKVMDIQSLLAQRSVPVQPKSPTPPSSPSPPPSPKFSSLKQATTLTKFGNLRTLADLGIKTTPTPTPTPAPISNVAPTFSALALSASDFLTAPSYNKPPQKLSIYEPQKISLSLPDDSPRFSKKKTVYSSIESVDSVKTDEDEIPEVPDEDIISEVDSIKEEEDDIFEENSEPEVSYTREVSDKESEEEIEETPTPKKAIKVAPSPQDDVYSDQFESESESPQKPAQQSEPEIVAKPVLKLPPKTLTSESESQATATSSEEKKSRHRRHKHSRHRSDHSRKASKRVVYSSEESDSGSGSDYSSEDSGDTRSHSSRSSRRSSHRRHHSHSSRSHGHRHSRKDSSHHNCGCMPPHTYIMPPMRLNEPASIARHVIDDDKVAAMAAHTPYTVAATDMYRRQLDMIRDLVRIGHNYQIGPPQSKFSYTTYEDTKAYITKNRPPTLSMEQALRMVAEESRY